MTGRGVVCTMAAVLLVSTWYAQGVGSAAPKPPPAPTISGTTFTSTYSSDDGRPFFEGGYQFKPSVLANVVGVECSNGGVGRLGAGPDRSPECSFHPAVKSATVTIRGRVEWLSLSKDIRARQFWSYNDRDYEYGPWITLHPKKFSLADVKAEAAKGYLAFTTPVNTAVSQFSLLEQAWGPSTPITQLRTDSLPLLTSFREVRPRLLDVAKLYEPVQSALKKQVGLIKVCELDLTSLVKPKTKIKKWKKQFHKDLLKLIKASGTVRSDLGLPPLPPLTKRS
jgi:hypothetical protein